MFKQVQSVKIVDEYNNEEIIKKAVIDTKARLVFALNNEGKTKAIINFDYLRRVEILDNEDTPIKRL